MITTQTKTIEINILPLKNNFRFKTPDNLFFSSSEILWRRAIGDGMVRVKKV